MNLESKYFDFVRAGHIARKNRKTAKGKQMRVCDWHDCQAEGTHPAPAPPREGGRRYFCLDHVRAYNTHYDFFEGMQTDEVEAYRRAAHTGHRPTWTMGARRAMGTAFQDPLELMGKHDHPDPTPRKPRISSGQRRALDALGLDDTASSEDVKTRYKDLIKRYHPDANGGDRRYETRLQRAIQAHDYLKASGYC